MFNSILVALDDSELAEEVINTVCNLMVSQETKIILCHVFPPAQSEMELPYDVPNTQNVAFSYLHTEKLQTYQSYLPVESTIELVMGNPPEEIIRLANIHNADLIVIGSRGLTGMKKIVQGSVSSQVVEDANCSVFVVKPS
ncbi:universal stress protein [Calothrix sp. PCC 6303]|uniref:universal stress protein n=1 Tax=Calothrix sp. PCC 6303 TaxID=1170562 RepID=UPI000A2F1C7E|nr:universal stress protein [Calothrix sp. PCC 6303]